MTAKDDIKALTYDISSSDRGRRSSKGEKGKKLRNKKGRRNRGGRNQNRRRRKRGRKDRGVS